MRRVHALWSQFLVMMCLRRRFCAALTNPITIRRNFHSSPLSRTTLAAVAPSQTVEPTQASKSSSFDTTPALPKVLLKRNRQSKSFRDGNQLVFSGSMEESSKQHDTLRMGDLVQVEVASAPPKTKKGSPSSASSKTNKNHGGNNNSKNMVIGWGLYNPTSMYRVRILSHFISSTNAAHRKKMTKDCGKGGATGQSSNVERDESLLRDQQGQLLKEILVDHLKKALLTRQALGLGVMNEGDSTTITDTYRLVHGEGDELSGLAVDVIGDQLAVVMSSAAWCEEHKTVVLESLATVLPPNYEFIWKTTPSRLKQDGYDVRNNDDDNIDAVEAENDPVISVENGIQYEIFPRRRYGQKTSVYCDQRENRQYLASLCKGKTVLDLCCYHGGFSLNAGNALAKAVVGVDSSQDAIEACLRNAQLNDLEDTTQFEKADISNYMRNCKTTFDVIVLDPPKLAPSLATLDKASRKYHSLNRDALKLISPKGGHLMTCTCSAAMTQKDGGRYFLQMVQQASLSAQRQVTLLRVSGAAPCHTQAPASFPAGNYLTAALFYVHATE